MKLLKSKKELLLVAAILAVAGVFYIFNTINSKKPAVYLEVTVDGTVVEMLDLSKDTDITINGYNEGTNHLVIKDGEAWISEATCPDGICVHQGKIHQNSEMIVCLPNLMIARVVDTAE